MTEHPTFCEVSALIDRDETISHSSSISQHAELRCQIWSDVIWHRADKSRRHIYNNAPCFVNDSIDVPVVGHRDGLIQRQELWNGFRPWTLECSVPTDNIRVRPWKERGKIIVPGPGTTSKWSYTSGLVTGHVFVCARRASGTTLCNW